jgi:hypothetical protein
MKPQKQSTDEGYKQSEKANEDCLECKLVGVGTLSGVALYVNHLRLSASIKRHRRFYAAISIGRNYLKTAIT